MESQAGKAAYKAEDDKMKEIKVVFIDKRTEASFEKLKTGKHEEKQLYEFIDRAKQDLRSNPQGYTRIPNRIIPKTYITKYGINNLWKYDLPNAWRLLYTITGTEIMILSVVLEWMSHKDYEKRFGYG